MENTSPNAEEPELPLPREHAESVPDCTLDNSHWAIGDSQFPKTKPVVNDSAYYELGLTVQCRYIPGLFDRQVMIRDSKTPIVVKKPQTKSDKVIEFCERSTTNRSSSWLLMPRSSSPELLKLLLIDERGQYQTMVDSVASDVERTRKRSGVTEFVKHI
jgi:hypothetical protein